MGVVIRSNRKIGKNEMCPCGSGLKFKYCHGDVKKLKICNRIANEKMIELIIEEKKKRGVEGFIHICKNCGHRFNKPYVASTDPIRVPRCPKCFSHNFEEIKNGKANS